MTAALEVKGLSSGYTQVAVVEDVAFSVEPGRYLGIVGSNGAGKSALMQAIAGLLPSLRGTIELAGIDITRHMPWRRWSEGLVLVPEARELWPDLTVEDHIRGGVVNAKGLAAREALDLAYELFPILTDLRSRAAGQLSGGQQQTLAIARAAVSRPKVLLLDEPSLGLSPIAVEQLVESLGTMRELDSMAVVIAEQSLTVVRETCERVLVLSLGKQVELGAANVVLTREAIEAAFL
ncbi:MAG: transporter ATP-binding protein [Subtercola sp.]|nr:transporter ATP-binding protein [Subtercola sp.]